MNPSLHLVKRFSVLLQYISALIVKNFCNEVPWGKCNDVPHTAVIRFVGNNVLNFMNEFYALKFTYHSGNPN